MTAAPGGASPGWARPRRGWALAAGAAVALAYLGGAVMGGHLSPLARRPLLDGLAPPPPYRWVKPPPELAASNKPPLGAQRAVRLTATGSEVSAIATDDGQASLVLEANAVPSSPGQRDVLVSIQPVDPSHLAPAPQGLQVAGNAYRIRLSYRPSGRPARLGGRATVVLVFPLLQTPVSSLFDYTVLASPDGKVWSREQSSATPGSHQVGAVLPSPGLVEVAVPPAPVEPAPNRIPLIAGLVGFGVVIAMGAVALARRLRRSGYDEEYEEEYDEDEQEEDRDGGRRR